MKKKHFLNLKGQKVNQEYTLIIEGIKKQCRKDASYDSSYNDSSYDSSLIERNKSSLGFNAKYCVGLWINTGKSSENFIIDFGQFLSPNLRQSGRLLLELVIKI